jgi:hypothetical protein
MMKKPLFLAVLLSASMFSGALSARDFRHFEIQTVDTLTQAIDTFIRYNAEMEKRLAAGTPDLETVTQIHEITYILENALKKIEKDLEKLAEVLEEVHVATEKSEIDTTEHKGREYLEQAAQFLQQIRAQ